MKDRLIIIQKLVDIPGIPNIKYTMTDFRTDTQKVVGLIREDILSGIYKPGEKLPQRKIAKKYSVSTIVAREALRVLNNEKIIIIEPRFGAMVEEITKGKLEGWYIVREALEGMAARLTCKNLTDIDEVILDELAAECDRKLPGNKLTNKEKAKLHQLLHEKIISLAHCDELTDLLGNFYLKTIILSIAYHIDWTKDEANWHSILISAIKSRNPDEAEKVMRLHVKRGLKRELEAIEG